MREYKYCRERVAGIKARLEAEGYNVIYIVTPEEKDISLATRVARANAKYAELKKKGMTGFLISVHNNAAGNGKWMNATGWSVFLSPNASSNSKKLGGFLFDAADNYGTKTRKPSANQKYWVSNLYICKNTNCPCVLTENFFMDNKAECEWMLTDNGKETVERIHVSGIKKYIASL